MNKIKSFFGYLLAVLGVPIILIAFMGAGTWMNLLVETTGLEISPLYTGGEVKYTASQDGMQIEIHEPVFAALIGESKEGFVQVTFGPKAAIGYINTEIDYDDDGAPDFRVQWDPSTTEATLIPYSALVLGIEGTYEFEDTYGLRVHLDNPRK